MRKSPPGAARQHPHPQRRVGLEALLQALLLFAGMLVAYYVLPLDEPLSGSAALTLVIGLALVVLLLSWQIRVIIRSPYPRLQAIKAFALIVPLFLVLYATTYYLLEHSSPNSFNVPLTRTDSLYFTMTVLSTVGFGDIVAVSQTARVVVTIQMATGLLLVGGAARLVVDAVRVGKARQRDAADTDTDAGTDTDAPDA